jgi:hypothetical protein
MFLIKHTAHLAIASAPENVSGITANCKTIPIIESISVTPNEHGKRGILAIGRAIEMRDLRRRPGNVEEGASTEQPVLQKWTC